MLHLFVNNVLFTLFDGVLSWTCALHFERCIVIPWWFIIMGMVFFICFSCWKINLLDFPVLFLCDIFRYSFQLRFEASWAWRPMRRDLGCLESPDFRGTGRWFWGPKLVVSRSNNSFDQQKTGRSMGLFPSYHPSWCWVMGFPGWLWSHLGHRKLGIFQVNSGC